MLPVLFCNVLLNVSEFSRFHKKNSYLCGHEFQTTTGCGVWPPCSLSQDLDIFKQKQIHMLVSWEGWGMERVLENACMLSCFYGKIPACFFNGALAIGSVAVFGLVNILQSNGLPVGHTFSFSDACVYVKE
ncbi:hypothetical protein VNO77_18613 [Canavalia gladiata]|uniref:Uncharacterized protein n=1 Tax=Canavalia gladiata TaxID=3824 RepID=A0AAN9LQ15_CANGL